MGRSQQTFSKKEKEKKRLKKREEKAKRKEERRAESKGMDDMIAYVDEFGNITDTPPDPNKKKEEIDASSIELGVPTREKEEDDGVKTGRIEFFNHDKGYGFIKEEGGRDSFFVHINGMDDDGLDEGDKIVFELEQGLKGLNAVRVKKA